MPSLSRIVGTGLLAAGVMLSLSPAATADPVPGPDPVPVPAPSANDGSDSAGCQDGEVMQDGNCVPAMTPVDTTAGADADPSDVPLRVTDTETSSTSTGIGADLVPNINGDPCTGYWQSMACAGQSEADLPAVQPHSTLSSSP